MPKLYLFLILGCCLVGQLRAEKVPVPDLLDQPVFKSSVSGSLESHWQYGVADARELNSLIQSPCFEYTMPYCMPKSNTDVGFVCSGQSAVIVTHLRSLGLKAMPFYLDWKNAKGGVEAHSMVIVPFRDKTNRLCHHILEVARTWPHQPVVELSHCETAEPKSAKALLESLQKAAREHFVHPPAHTRERIAADLPQRVGIPEDSPFTARIVEEPFDLKDPYNSDAPIWTLEKGKLACPKGLCTVHDVAVHMKIDQRRVDPTDSRTFKNTEIIVDYSDSQQYACVQMCRAEDCILKQTGREAPAGLKVNWPILRATCPQAAVLRSHIVNPKFSCKSQCEEARPGYLGGFYKADAKENPMKCSPVGPLHHRVRKPKPDDHAPPDGSDVPNRTIKKG